jgi:hypothetical protein
MSDKEWDKGTAVNHTLVHAWRSRPVSKEACGWCSELWNPDVDWAGNQINLGESNVATGISLHVGRG